MGGQKWEGLGASVECVAGELLDLKEGCHGVSKWGSTSRVQGKTGRTKQSPRTLAGAGGLPCCPYRC